MHILWVCCTVPGERECVKPNMCTQKGKLLDNRHQRGGDKCPRYSIVRISDVVYMKFGLLQTRGKAHESGLETNGSQLVTD